MNKTDLRRWRLLAAAVFLAAVVVLVERGWHDRSPAHGDVTVVTAGSRSPAPGAAANRSDTAEPAAAGNGPARASSPAPPRHFGEPVVAEDRLLTPLLAEAPDDIKIRHHLIGMQLAAKADAPEEQRWRDLLDRRFGAVAGQMRVRCSVTTCELVATIPEQISLLASSPGHLIDDQATGDCKPVYAAGFTAGGRARVEYYSRSAC